jgi:leader peptidase (prepilin peptidase)/N-methyltransferase
MDSLFEARLFLLLSAPFIGSFLGVLIERLPAGRPLALGRSTCPRCGHVLGFADLVPIVSWLLGRARCRYCDGKIAWFYPAIEVAALVIALWSLAVLPGWLAWAGCGLGWTLLVLSVIDYRWYVLPNALTVPLAVGGLLVAWLMEPGALMGNVAGAVIGFLGFVLLGWVYRRLRGRDGLGTGDAWLFGAIGAWVGWPGIPTVLLYAGLSGLLWTVIQAQRGEPVALHTRLAFGPHLCLAGWIVWLYGPLQIT